MSYEDQESQDQTGGTSLASRLVYLVPLLLFIGLAAYFVKGLERDASLLPSALLDKPSPVFDLPPLYDGEPNFSSEGLKGNGVQLVNVFASWCIPCRIEHPVLMKYIKSEGIVVNGLNWKDKKFDAISWLKALGNGYNRVGHDLNGRVGIDWGVYGVPETFIVRGDGTIAYKHFGPLLKHNYDDFLAAYNEVTK